MTVGCVILGGLWDLPPPPPPPSNNYRGHNNYVKALKFIVDLNHVYLLHHCYNYLSTVSYQVPTSGQLLLTKKGHQNGPTQNVCHSLPFHQQQQVVALCLYCNLYNFSVRCVTLTFSLHALAPNCSLMCFMYNSKI